MTTEARRVALFPESHLLIQLPDDAGCVGAMLIILNDDAVYISWISRHRQGFVVDCQRKPTKNHLILHRASCSVIKPHKRARLTTGAHIKACSLDAAELAAWAMEQTGGGVIACSECQPHHEEPASAEHHATHALTRLGRDILSYTLDLAVMYLDGVETHYHPNVQDIAVYLGKSAGQIMPAVRRLIEEGYLDCDLPVTDGAWPAASIIYPTARALRTIPAFDAMPDGALEAELAGLKVPDRSSQS
jgi:hypothetical protein